MVEQINLKRNIKNNGGNMKEKFLELLKKVNREGINELIEFIEKTDFILSQFQHLFDFYGNICF